MKTKLFMLLTMMFVSMGAFAQSNEPLEGDVNKDGKVDVADIVKVIDIMAAGEQPQPTVYYWYVGTTNPINMTNTVPVVTDNTSMGWRYIGNEVPTYTMSSPLWDGQINEIVFDNYNDVTAYIALPNSDIKVRNGFGNDVTSEMTLLGTKELNGVTYTVYQNSSNVMGWSLDLLVY